MISHHIDNALFRVDFHQTYIDLYEDIFQWEEEEKYNSIFSEDETEINKNPDQFAGLDDNQVTHYREELEYHRHKLERAKVRLNICMLTFNGGWCF